MTKGQTMPHDTDKIELRVTRPGMYPHDCQNPEHMEGHYFRGCDYNAAMTKATTKFPGERLNIQIFKRKVDGVWVREEDGRLAKITRESLAILRQMREFQP
jgi:hypothetical protein